jgi:hypothetical protein
MSNTRKKIIRDGLPLYNKGQKMSKTSLYKNMKGHLKYDVTLEWLQQFEDIEKLKFLNKSLSRSRDRKDINSELYMSFIEKFYYDKKFNTLFDKYIETNDKWIRPSLDHIQAKSKGGELNNINNLQFISWLENRAKYNLEQDEWNEIKRRINDYF